MAEHREHAADFSEYKSTDKWAKEWEEGQSAGFHLNEINGILKKYLDKMTKGRTGLKFLMPFSGKVVDMKWLADMGHTVVGCDCAEQAFKEFFLEQKVEYTTEKVDKFTVFKSKDERLRMYCGDFYEFTRDHEGLFDIIWDRGGFNAVNLSEQSKYADLVMTLMKPDCQYYLLNFDSDEKEFEQWGFLSDDDLKRFFGEKCNLELRAEFIDAEQYNGDLCKGCGFMEKLTIITPKV